jgi:hypothetical protein
MRDAVGMGHDQVDVVAAAGDSEVEEQVLLLRGGQALFGLLQQGRMRPGVAGHGADVGLNHADGRLQLLGYGSSLPRRLQRPERRRVAKAIGTLSRSREKQHRCQGGVTVAWEACECSLLILQSS